MKRVPLRRRLFLLAAAAILPIAVMSAVALYAVYRQQQQQQTQDAGLEIARALSTAVDSELHRTVSVLDVLATSVRLESSDLRGFHERAARYRAKQTHWRAIVLIDPEGKQVLNTALPYGAALPAVVEKDMRAAFAPTRERVAPSSSR